MWKWLGAATAATDKDPEKEGSSAAPSRVLHTGSLNASQAGSAGSFKQADSDKSPVVQVTDRICAFVFGTFSVQRLQNNVHEICGHAHHASSVGTGTVIALALG